MNTTRKELYNNLTKIMLKIMYLTRLRAGNVKQYIESLLETNEITVEAKCINGNLHIGYFGNQFSLKDLYKNTKVFGNGSKFLLNLDIEYNYINGFNTYTFKSIGTESFTKEYKLVGNMENCGTGIFNLIQDVKDGLNYTDTGHAIMEILTNAIYYSNPVIHKIPMFKFYLEVIKIGLSKSI